MNKKLLSAETILLLASVLVFRGTWLLIDTQPIMQETWLLWLSLIVGLAVTILCLNYILRQGKKQQ
jgi:hypothetical protein